MFFGEVILKRLVRQRRGFGLGAQVGTFTFKKERNSRRNCVFGLTSSAMSYNRIGASRELIITTS